MVRPVTLDNTTLPATRERVAGFAESRSFVRFITTLIVINAVTLGVKADSSLFSAYDAYLLWFDRLVISVFTVELMLKLYAYRLAFFRSGWNVFDFVIVSISLVPQEAGLAVLRAFRIFRIFRLISIIPQMRKVIGALLHAIPGMASIISVMFVIVYVAAVLSMQLFGQAGHNGHYCYANLARPALSGRPDSGRTTHYPA